MAEEGEIQLGEEQVLNAYGQDFGEEFSEDRKDWDVKQYCRQIDIRICRASNDGFELEFDIVNIEAPYANALRRILLAEVPSMAIEKVYMYQNTSLIQDEVLAHRLGLIPITADPRLFNYATPPPESRHGAAPEEPEVNPREGVVFELKIQCTKNAHPPAGSSDPTDLYKNAHVYTKSLKWVPVGDQEQRMGDRPPAPVYPDILLAKLRPKQEMEFRGRRVMICEHLTVLYKNAHVYTNSLKWVPVGDQERRMGDRPPAPVYPDILLAKLRPKQEMEFRCHCVKGIGRDHAKFSPVATASYRLLPDIRLTREIKGEAAHRFKDCFSEGVIEIVKDSEGEDMAVVKDPRKDMCSRNVFRFKDSFSEWVIEIVKDEEGEDVAVVKDPRKDIMQQKCFQMPMFYIFHRPIADADADCFKLSKKEDICQYCGHADLADAAVLTRKRRHFIFSVESTGALRSQDLVVEACRVMRAKCQKVVKLLDRFL